MHYVHKNSHGTDLALGGHGIVSLTEAGPGKRETAYRTPKEGVKEVEKDSCVEATTAEPVPRGLVPTFLGQDPIRACRVSLTS